VRNAVSAGGPVKRAKVMLYIGDRVRTLVTET
jgi:hypothetical protein